MNRLVLIDSHAIIHRAYHALPPMHDSSGQMTNAVYGFVSMLLRTVNDLKPTHIIAAFDLPTATFRHSEYIAYQAQRPSMDEDLIGQVQLVRDTVAAAGIPLYEKEGFEADDVIGTLAVQAIADPMAKGPRIKKSTIDEVIIVTGDRDIMQLVNGKVRVYAPVKGLSEAKLYMESDVKKYLGVKPSQIIDYKALMGDSSDNYPGVPGIGPKTAVTLLEKYKDLDGIYKALDTKNWVLGDTVAKKLKEGKESAVLSQKLATIVKNVPIKLNLKNARLNDLSRDEKFLNQLRKLGFRSLIKRVTGGAESLAIQSKSKKNPPAGGNGQMGLL